MVALLEQRVRADSDDRGVTRSIEEPARSGAARNSPAGRVIVVAGPQPEVLVVAGRARHEGRHPAMRHVGPPRVVRKARRGVAGDDVERPGERRRRQDRRRSDGKDECAKTCVHARTPRHGLNSPPPLLGAGAGWTRALEALGVNSDEPAGADSGILDSPLVSTFGCGRGFALTGAAFGGWYAAGVRVGRCGAS